MKKNMISWIAQIIVIAILGMTLYGKFTDAPEVVELFSKIDMGPVGYKLIGAFELVACVMLLIPKSAIWGAILSWGLMSGALLGHITKIGFAGELGLLAGMAAVAWVLSCLIIFLRSRQVSFISKMFGAENPNDAH